MAHVLKFTVLWQKWIYRQVTLTQIPNSCGGQLSGKRGEERFWPTDKHS